MDAGNAFDLSQSSAYRQLGSNHTNAIPPQRIAEVPDLQTDSCWEAESECLPMS